MNRRVFFLDNIKSYDLPVVYAMAKGLIYPSEYEGFGLPILEAQKIGIPVITNKIQQSLRWQGMVVSF